MTMQMNDLLDTLATTLHAKIIAGTATPKELDIARQLLKDNGIQARMTGGNGVHRLSQSLPFTEDSQLEESNVLPFAAKAG